uniref:SAM domain-containing protein n=1 Tax=Romanomermis culicivorax TaxID=13658 RepID=A0A915KJB0_ROMCU
MISTPISSHSLPDIDPDEWNCEQVHDWLKSAGFEQYAHQIAVEHKIDGKILLLLTENDLREKPLQLSILGDIKRLYAAIGKLKIVSSSFRNNSDDLTNDSQSIYSNNGCRSFAENGGSFARDLINNDSIRQRINAAQNLNGISIQVYEHRRIDRSNVIEQIEAPDTQMKCMIKTGLAALYCSISLLLTSFVMVIVHDRVPDMKTYPPLPDIVLDSIPLIPWAFQVCEILASALGFTWLLVLIFHKHRTILLRRMFSLTGTVFLLRCVTMLITSLSVPGVHLECFSQTYVSFSDKIKQALRIWYGMGMSLRGVRTCGDYMFSGHTTVVTLLNHFVTEYTPDDWYYIHTASWVMNLFSVFFILAGHEHYSIDVFVAFYISSRLFLYYHTMAYHAKSMAVSDGRTRIWFPLFWFFESGGQVGRVENEYEWPLPDGETLKKLWNGLLKLISAAVSFENLKMKFWRQELVVIDKRAIIINDNSTSNAKSMKKSPKLKQYSTTHNEESDLLAVHSEKKVRQSKMNGKTKNS